MPNIYRQARYLHRMCVTKARLFLSDHRLPDPETVYWIDPKRVVYYTNYRRIDRQLFEKGAAERVRRQAFREQVFDRYGDKGKIIGGDWDLSNYRFSDLAVYEAIELRMRENIEWKETSFFRIVLARIQAGERLWRCSNKEDFVERCRYIDRLIDSIKEVGYRLNHEILIKGDDPSSLAKHPVVSDEITVNIGRDGAYLFQDGRHRLAVAQILGLKKVPVKILVRHASWQKLRDYSGPQALWRSPRDQESL